MPRWDSGTEWKCILECFYLYPVLVQLEPSYELTFDIDIISCEYNNLYMLDLTKIV